MTTPRRLLVDPVNVCSSMPVLRCDGCCTGRNTLKNRSSYKGGEYGAQQACPGEFKAPDGVAREDRNIGLE